MEYDLDKFSDEDIAYLKSVTNAIAVKTKPPVKTEVEKKKNPKIPDDAEEFNGHYYKFYSDSTKWSTCKNKCQMRGGHLVVIDSHEENQFVYELLKKNGIRQAWIGLERSLNQWKWIKMAKSDFRNWAKDQPTADKSTKSSTMGVGVNACMYGQLFPPGHPSHYSRNLYHGKWADCLGDNKDVNGYVCEFEN